jgi:uncharacterized membrane protein
MKNNFRTVKASLIMGLLLISMFAVLIPTNLVRGGGLIGFSSLVEIEWKDVHNATLAIKPFEESRPYTLLVTYSLTKGPFGGLLYSSLYAGRRVDIKLNIESYPSEWSTVTMFDNTISFGLPLISTETQEFTHQLLISVDDKAPAFKEGKIAIRVTVDAIGMIQKFDSVIELQIKPDYAPKLNVIAEPQHMIIGPMDTASIPIKVTNLGNGETKISFKVPNPPSGWMTIVTDQIILAPDQTESVYLTVKPPKGFGYHDDSVTLIVEYTPAWSEDIEKKGVTEQVSVGIESRGISVIGIEVILPIIILILLIIFFVYYLLKKMRRK